MSLSIILTISAVLSPILSLSPPLQAQAPLLSAPQTLGPDREIAKINAPQIFNTVSSAARQWGSSLHHNGVSFFPASIPANTHLYHGTGSNASITGMEWLAFEIEHAEGFARPRRGRPPKPPPGENPYPPPGHGGPPPPPGHGGPPPPLLPREISWLGAMHRGDDGHDHDPDDGEDARGYLHIYKTKKELNLLYIDGMSAGKTNMGTLDSQDFLLLSQNSSSFFADYERATSLCSLGKEWGIEGFVRMEMGFEVILCDFETGLELESARARPSGEGWEDGMSPFEILRGASLRYGGLGSRLKVDFSRMVSAWWYEGLNLTNPDQKRADVPRISIVDVERLKTVKNDLGTLVKEGWGEVIDWQGTVDMIVLRYADRLQMMAGSEASKSALKTEISVLLTLYIDYRDANISAAVEKCSLHYLGSGVLRTSSDHLIYDSLLTVTSNICSTLFKVRELILDDENDQNSDDSGLEESKYALKELIKYLSWSRWLECGKCAYDEICFVAIWPWGSAEDHFTPRCTKGNSLETRNGYWDW